MNRTALFIFALALAAATTACAQESTEQDVVKEAADLAEEPADAVPALADSAQDDASPESSPIMSEPLDGSSIEAFKASLAKVEKQGTGAEYRSLKGSVSHLLTYDLKHRGDLAGFYATLDGKTPAEIIKMAGR